MTRSASPPAHGGAYQDFPGAPADYLIATSASSTKRLFEAAVTHVQDRLNWYDKKAFEFSRLAKSVRFVAIACFVIGTATPVITALIIKLPGKSPGQQASEFLNWPITEMGYLLLAIAGALVVFDQFFDLSGSWIRFRQAQAKLEVQVADLRYSWAALLMQSGGIMPEGAAAAKFIGLLRDFVVRVEMTAEAETKEWATQFRSRMQAFDSNSALKVRPPGEDKPEQRATSDAQSDGGGKGPPPSGQSASGEPTVKVRLSVADAETTQQLSLTLNDHGLALPDGGNIEVSLEVDRQHTFTGRGMRNGQQVQGTLQISPTQDDEGKPLLLTLQP